MDHEVEKQLTKKLQKRLRPSWCELRYDERRNRSYLIGKKKETDEMTTMCLIRGNKSMNFQGLKNHIQDSGHSSIELAIYSNDSTTVFYKCQIGLKSPLSKEQNIEPSNENIED